ncbi:MAG: OsmC family protein [Rhodopila sp.]
MTAATEGTGTAVPPQRTLHCRTVAAGGFQHLSYVRKLPPIQVEERLGLTRDGTAATPSEILLVALGSCLATRIHADAVTANIAIRSLEIEIEGRFATSSMWDPTSTAPGPVGFEAIRVSVHLQADASPEALRALVAHAVLWSPVANTLHDPVHLDVRFGGAGSAGANRVEG